jgi:predicted metal-dependent hydrolase
LKQPEHYSIINLPTVGEIYLERSSRAKYINISVKSSTKVRVAVPINISFDKAEIFARQKIDWIKNQLNKYKKLDLVLIRNKQPGPGFEENILKRLNQLALKHGFNYNKVTFKRMTSRWGSCSYANNISLNKRLYILPSHLQDCIILHELLHTKIKNHGKEFWAELNRLKKGAKYLHKTINENFPLGLG